MKLDTTELLTIIESFKKRTISCLYTFSRVLQYIYRQLFEAFETQTVLRKIT